MSKTLGEVVRERRELLGMKAYELADAIGRRPSLISRIENGDYKETPPPDVIAGLAEALRVSQVELLEACGYDLHQVTHAIEDDPVLADLIERLRRLPLTGKRPSAIRGVIDTFAENDRIGHESGHRVGTSGDTGDEVRLAGL